MTFQRELLIDSISGNTKLFWGHDRHEGVQVDPFTFIHEERRHNDDCPAESASAPNQGGKC